MKGCETAIYRGEWGTIYYGTDRPVCKGSISNVLAQGFQFAVAGRKTVPLPGRHAKGVYVLKRRAGRKGDVDVTKYIRDSGSLGLRAFVVLLGMLAVLAMAVRAVAFDAPRWVAALYLEQKKMVGLRWVPVPGVAAYRVFRSTTAGKGQQEIAAPSVPTYVDAAIEPGKTYYYSVEAIAGVEAGPLSDEKSVIIPGGVNTPEITQVNLTTTLEFGKPVSRVAILWAGKGPAVAYNLYRSMEFGKPGEIIASMNEPRYVDTAIEPGKTYYYTVTALDSAFQETKPSGERSIFISKSGALQMWLEASGYAQHTAERWNCGVHWNTLTEADRYRIILDGAVVGETQGTTYSLPIPYGLENHVIRIEAIDQGGSTVGSAERKRAGFDPYEANAVFLLQGEGTNGFLERAAIEDVKTALKRVVANHPELEFIQYGHGWQATNAVTEFWLDSGEFSHEPATSPELAEIDHIFGIERDRSCRRVKLAKAVDLWTMGQLYDRIPGVRFVWPGFRSRITGDWYYPRMPSRLEIPLPGTFAIRVSDYFNLFLIKKGRVWHFIFKLGQGDCPAGCGGKYYYVTYDRNNGDVTFETDGEPQSGIPMWGIPARHNSRPFPSAACLFRVCAEGRWWERIHALDVVGRLLTGRTGIFGEDLGNQEKELLDGVQSRRVEALETFISNLAHEDKDVRALAHWWLRVLAGADLGDDDKSVDRWRRWATEWNGVPPPAPEPRAR
jgi:hypothetical protein